jgi:hypothetical protein
MLSGVDSLLDPGEGSSEEGDELLLLFEPLLSEPSGDEFVYGGDCDFYVSV